MGATAKTTPIVTVLALALGLLIGPQAPSASAQDLSTPLPRQALLPAVLAASGTHILVRADLSYRISHDAGKTWSIADFPCPDTYKDACLDGEADARVGRVADGILTSVSPEANQVDAYSLVTNSSVGTPFTLSFGESVVDRVGALVLTQTWPANTFHLHSLLDNTSSEVALPTDAIISLLPDGSFLVRNGGATQWAHQHGDGSSTPLLTLPMGTSEIELSGFLLAYRANTKTICVLNIETTAKTCRALTSTHEYLAALSSAGALTRHNATTLYWYPLANGALGAPLRWPIPKGLEGYAVQVSAENSPVVVAVTAPSTKLKLFTAKRSITTASLAWATRPVVPRSLALTNTAILGGSDIRSSSAPWVRSLTSSKIGSAKKLPGIGQVAASGSRWAVSGAKLRFYDRGKLATTTSAPESDQLIFAGPYLLARPLCRKAPLVTDDDCYVPAVLRTAAGKLVATSAVTEDIFGEIKVVRAGDGTVRSRTVLISNFLYSNATPIEVTLPDAGPDAYFTDVRVWGDTVAATVWPGGSALPYPIVINYRLDQTYTGTLGQQVKALGDGVVVSVAPHDTTIQAWDFVHGTTRTIPASAGPVALNGARLAYVHNGRLMLTTLTGVAQSAPRILGMTVKKIGSRTWTMDVDITKATKAGRIEIRDLGGTLVRSLHVDASGTGSLRKITWNGRTTSGKAARAGRYAARMVVDAADGTGAVTGVHGASTTLAEFVIK